MNSYKKIVSSATGKFITNIDTDLVGAFKIITNTAAQKLIQRTTELCKPERVRVYTGTAAEKAELLQSLVDDGVLTPLTDPRFENCYYARTDETDVARAEKRTFSCTNTPEEAGIGNYYLNADEATATLIGKFNGVMAGRTMWVVPMRMGPKGSAYSEVGIQICDSGYAVANLQIMNQVEPSVVEEINTTPKGFISGLASVGAPLAPGEKSVVWPCIRNPNERYFCVFPSTPSRIKTEDDVRALPPVVSLGSGYGGNMILSKKFFALRVATLLGEQEGWIPAHMALIEINLPTGEKKYVAAAFPSACGKTNLAMMKVIQERYGDATVRTVGDDIVWIHPEADGWYAINPENGFFGVAPGTSTTTNPHAFEMVHHNTIFTNVAQTAEGGVWWEGYSKTAPEGLTDWRGRTAGPGNEKTAAHPNSRFTTPATQCAVLSEAFHDPKGVKIDWFLFGGRRDDTLPLVLIAESWEQAMLHGATMGSNATAAADQEGKQYDPFADRPFQPKDPADYALHFYKLGLDHPVGRPRVALVNWFLKSPETGQFIWEGFSANFAVLQALLNYAEHPEIGFSTPVGRQLRHDDIQIGNSCADENLSLLLMVDSEKWATELADAQKFLSEKMGGAIADVLIQEIKKIRDQLAEAASSS